MDILVCLEGSACSASAIDVAIGFARDLGATLVGLAIVDEPDIVAGAATSIGRARTESAPPRARTDAL